MTGSNSPAARAAEAYRRKGQRIVLRSVTTVTPQAIQTAGLTPAAVPGDRFTNPPTITNPRVTATALPAAQSVLVTADALQGAILPGDRWRVVGMTSWWTVTALALPQGVLSSALTLPTPQVQISFSPVFSGTPPAGATLPIEFAWAADVPCFARISSFPAQLVNGQNIVVGSLRISIPAYGLAKQPKIGDRILLDGVTLSAEITSCDPVYLQTGQIAVWSIVAVPHGAF